MNTTDIIPIEPGADVRFYEIQAVDLFEAYRSGDLESVTRIRKYGVRYDELVDAMSADYTIDSVRSVIALDHALKLYFKIRSLI